VSGLAPLSPAGPGQPIDGTRQDVVEALPVEVKALVVGPALDLIRAAERGGTSDATLHLMRGLLRRVIRGLYEVEVRRQPASAPLVDFDPTEQ